MNCDRLDSLLGLTDPEARLDAAVAARHLAHCERCGERYPEVALLLAPAAAADRPAVRALPAVARAAAAAAALACFAVLLAGRHRPTPAGEHVRVPVLESSTIARVETFAVGGRPVAWTTVRSTFRPALPAHLRGALR